MSSSSVVGNLGDPEIGYPTAGLEALDLALLGIDDLRKVTVESGLARTGTRAELV